MPSPFSSSPEEIKTINELNLSPRPFQKTSHSVRRDGLLHGSEKNQLHGFFSSQERYQEVEALRQISLSKGRVKENRADWSDESRLVPIGPFARKNHLKNSEENAAFSNGSSLVMDTRAHNVPNPKTDLNSRLYRAEHVTNDVIVKNAIGLSGQSVSISAVHDMGKNPMQARRVCGTEFRMQQEIIAMKEDPTYKWAW